MSTTTFDVDDRQEFRARVHAWLEANAPKKGTPEDFSSLHIVSADTAE